MVTHDVISDKDYILRGAAEMVVDFRMLGCILGKEYEEPLIDPVCVCSLGKAFRMNNELTVATRSVR